MSEHSSPAVPADAPPPGGVGIGSAPARRRNIADATRTWRLNLANNPWLARFRSGIYAFFFAPVAFVLMGLGVTSMQVEASVGQPLSSSEGLVCLALATFLLCTLTFNDGLSMANSVVTLAWSVIIGVAQLSGLTVYADRMIVPLQGADSRAAMVWSLYPVAVIAICAGASLAIYEVQQTTRILLSLLGSQGTSPAPAHPGKNGTDSAGPAAASLTEHFRAETRPAPRGEVNSGPGATDVPAPAGTPEGAGARRTKHQNVRTVVALSAVVCAVAANAVYVIAAPSNSIRVAALGFHTLTDIDHPDIVLGLLGAVLLGLVAWSSRLSASGPVIVAVAVMVLPSYFIYPVWATLTGHVATPGQSLSTSFALAAPVVTALGLTLGALSFSVYASRKSLNHLVHRAQHGGVAAEK